MKGHAPPGQCGRRQRGERALLAALGLTGAAAVAGGLLLIVRPDGSLLQARRSALAGTPFRDWRLPGVLLAVLVGGGGLGSAGWAAARAPYARQVCVAYGIGLVGFETAEWVTVGPQALEVIFAAVGVVIALLAGSSRSLPSGRRSRGTSLP